MPSAIGATRLVRTARTTGRGAFRNWRQRISPQDLWRIGGRGGGRGGGGWGGGGGPGGPGVPPPPGGGPPPHPRLRRGGRRPGGRRGGGGGRANTPRPRTPPRPAPR